jgi:hypothetical protein
VDSEARPRGHDVLARALISAWVHSLSRFDKLT